MSSTIWGPAFDAEISYRRSTIAAAAAPRRAGRARRNRARRAADTYTTFVGDAPTTSPRR